VVVTIHCVLNLLDAPGGRKVPESRADGAAASEESVSGYDAIAGARCQKENGGIIETTERNSRGI
jgi:hypothetical protein